MTTDALDIAEVLEVLRDMKDGSEALQDQVTEFSSREYDKFYDAYERATPLLTRAEATGVLPPKPQVDSRDDSDAEVPTSDDPEDPIDSLGYVLVLFNEAARMVRSVRNERLEAACLGELEGRQGGWVGHFVRDVVEDTIDRNVGRADR